VKRLPTLLAVAALAAVCAADEAGAVRAFDRAKRTEPELIAFLKRMPKGGDLHNHVSGAVYADFMLDAAVRKGLFFDPASGTFTSDSTKIPAQRVLSDNNLLYQFLNGVSMRGWKGGGQSGHDHFFATFGLFGDALGSIDPVDALAEVIGRAQAQNVQYMELMTGVTPGAASSEYFASVPDSTDMAKALEALRPRLQKLLAASKPFLDQRGQAIADRLRLREPVTSTANPITVRYIWSCNRLSSNDQFFAQAAAGLFLAANDPRVAGVNMVAPEDHPNSRVNFERQMQMLDFLWRELGKPNLTLHGGELSLPISPVESMRNRIRRMIEMGHARRIGHGVSIAWEDDLPGLLKKMKDEGIAVEICLTSNMAILGVEGDRHPLRLYREAGVPVFLNTDDEGVSRSNLTMEWVRGVRDQKLGYKDLKEMARNVVEYSFLTGQSLYERRNYGKLANAFKDCRRPEWKPSAEAERLLAQSEKMRVQLRLERAFVEFENRF